MASHESNIDIVKLLIEFIRKKEKSISVRLRNREIGFKTLFPQIAFLNVQDGRKKTALHYAAKSGNIELWNLLIESGALMLQDENGETPKDILNKQSSQHSMDELSNLEWLLVKSKWFFFPIMVYGGPQSQDQKMHSTC